jgi:hypothetical protein
LPVNLGVRLSCFITLKGAPMSKVKKDPAEKLMEATKLTTQGNQNFRARIIYKSGTSQDFLMVATSTTVFELMRKDFSDHLAKGTPKFGFYVLSQGAVIVNWPDVSSFYESID